MHKKSNPILISVLFSTEINLVFVICWHFTKVFPAHLAEAHYVPVIPAHCMNQLFKFPSWPQSSHIPCSNRDVFSTSDFLFIVILGCDRSGIKVLLMLFVMVSLGQNSAWWSPSLSTLFLLTTAEIHDYCMAQLGHKHMAVDSKSRTSYFLPASH